jgi:hypothetical protein
METRSEGGARRRKRRRARVAVVWSFILYRPELIQALHCCCWWCFRFLCELAEAGCGAGKVG